MDCHNLLRKVVVILIIWIEVMQFTFVDRKTDPENVQKRPRGRIDYVTSPGCEKGEIRFGQDVIIYGKDLTLSYGDSVEIHTPNGQTYGHLFNLRNGEPVVWSDGHIESNDAFVEYDDNHIRFKWFQAIKKEDVVGKTVSETGLPVPMSSLKTVCRDSIKMMHKRL